MGYFYVDESIHDRHGFTVVAVVFSEVDLTPLVHGLWTDSGRDPQQFEYKSSSPKAGNESVTRLIQSRWEAKKGKGSPTIDRSSFQSLRTRLWTWVVSSTN